MPTGFTSISTGEYHTWATLAGGSARLADGSTRLGDGSRKLAGGLSDGAEKIPDADPDDGRDESEMRHALYLYRWTTAPIAPATAS